MRGRCHWTLAAANSFIPSCPRQRLHRPRRLNQGALQLDRKPTRFTSDGEAGWTTATMNPETTALNPTITHKPWLRLMLTWLAALLAGLSFFPAALATVSLGLSGGRNIHFGFVIETATLKVIWLAEIALIALVPLVTARLLGYCQVRFWRWGLAGFGSLLVWLGIWYLSSLGNINLSYWLMRNALISYYAHALPFAIAAAGMLAVSWLGASTILWRNWKGLLQGLGVGILLATINGTLKVTVLHESSSLMLSDFLVGLPFVWTSAVLFIERAVGRVDRNAYLVWLGLTLVMFVLSIVIVRSAKFW